MRRGVESLTKLAGLPSKTKVEKIIFGEISCRILFTDLTSQIDHKLRRAIYFPHRNYLDM